MPAAIGVHEGLRERATRDPGAVQARALRILTVMNCRGTHRSGMPTANASISRELRVLGCEVDQLYLEDFPRWVGRVPLNYALFGPASIPIIRRLEARGGGYDVMQFSGGDGYVAPLLRRDPSGRRRLIVARCHGLEHRYWQAFRSEVDRGFESATLRHRLYFGGLRLLQVEQTIRRADLFNCHTEADADYVITRGWKRSEQVAVLPSGIEPAWFGGPLARVERGKRILFCGSWTWMKGIRVLVNVFGRLAALDQDVTLTIAGAGTDEGAVLAAFPEALHRRLSVKPALSHSEVLQEIARHDLLLATSLFEGFGTVVAEAMAAGLPVVASDVGGAVDLVRDGETGYRVPAGDLEGFVTACRSVFSAGPAEWLAMQRAARNGVQGITWSDVARRTMHAYQEALEEVRHGR